MNETRIMNPRNARSSRRARARNFWERSQKPAHDPAAAQAFGEKLAGVLNSAGLALMVSLGHRSGLFDAMAGQGALGAEQLAKRAKLNERYVREWLGAMVTGGIVRYLPHERTYELPAEHAACLTRAAAPNNMAATMQWIPVLGSVEDGVLEAFRFGGGVRYEAYARFHEVMAEESAQTTVAGLHEHILPLVDGLKARLDSGIEVLDIGCGAGRALNALAAAYPNSRFTGYDFSEEGIARARATAADAKLENVRFEVRDAARLGECERYDLITAFDAVHDQADPVGVLDGIAAALKPSGVFLMQDIHSSSHLHKNQAHPLGPFLYTISCMHCMTVSLAQGGAGLGTCWGVELAQEMLAGAGFARVSVHTLPHDALNAYFVARKA